MCDKEPTPEMWEIRPAGDFPECNLCFNYAMIIDGKFTYRCKKCNAS